MGDKHDEEPSLELPSLFGRKKKKPAPEASAPAATPVAPPVAPPAAVTPPPPPVTPPAAPPAAPQATPQPVEQPAPVQVVAPSPAAKPKRPWSRLTRPGPAESPEPLPVEDSEPFEFKLPALPPRVAAGITGAVVGLVGSLLTFGALQGCEAVRGTDSCGNPGFFFLLVILAAMIVLGAALLLAWDVTDPKSTSALAVGILCVIVLLILMPQLLEWWMFLVIPALTALCYLASHAISTALVEED